MNYCVRLLELKRRSLRQGIWYRVLSVLERAQVDLTFRVIRRVRSPFLAKVLDRIIGKLSSAMLNRVSIVVRSIGFPSALKLSRIAQRWGNKSAAKWASDSGFARFLAILHLNTISKSARQGCCR